MQETRVQSLGQEDPLEKGMVTHASVLACRIPWIEEPGGRQSVGSLRVRQDWDTNIFTFTIGIVGITSKLQAKVLLTCVFTSHFLSLLPRGSHYYYKVLKTHGQCQQFSSFIVNSHVVCLLNPSKKFQLTQTFRLISKKFRVQNLLRKLFYA